MKEPSPSMPLVDLTDEQLDRGLRQLLEKSTAEEKDSDELQTTVQDLQVHRIKLEMQNRALREMQTELAQSVQRYADLYDNLPLPYLTVKPSGEIVGVNRAATDWLQVDRPALLSRFLGKYFDAYDAGRFAAHLEGCLRSDRPARLELTLRVPHDAPRAVQLCTRRAATADAGGPVLQVAMTDISKLKQSQDVLADIKREQEAFNYSISHDLRAPLVTINNYAGVVLSDFGDKLDPEARNMVERIRVAAQRMEETLSHLRHYSSLAQAELPMQVVNVDALVTEILLEQRPLIERVQAEVWVDRPLACVQGARDLVAQVLGILLSNALKFTAPGEKPKVKLYSQSGDRVAVLKVVDQGIGIEAKHHQRIFNVFERLHGYSRYPGSGLGLAIAKRAVERMQGRIWCESQPGKGSCFSVELPLA